LRGAIAVALDSSRNVSRARNKRDVCENGLILMPIAMLRPTQMAVGMRSVKCKRRKIEDQVDRRKRLEKALTRRPIPVVRGAGNELFMVDHHHFGLALWQAEVESAYVRVIEDISSLSQAEFWRQMETDGRAYPYDEDGRRVRPEHLPRRLHGLRDDPFRDLAWEVREAGGYIKTRTPYAEFQWANLFREHIKHASVRRKTASAFERAMKLCRSNEAVGLPGYLRAH
jgi:hypothetical protein